MAPLKKSRFKKPLVKILLCTVGALWFGLLVAQQPKDKVYAVFLLNFARFIEWPKDASTDEFVIGVLDDPPLASELKNVAKLRTIGNQKIRVKEYQAISQVDFCHILFVPEHESAQVPTIIGMFPYSAMLVVTEKEGLAKAGSNINFLVMNGKIKFELNLRAMRGRGLKVSAELQAFSVPIE